MLSSIGTSSLKRVGPLACCVGTVALAGVWLSSCQQGEIRGSPELQVATDSRDSSGIVILDIGESPNSLAARETGIRTLAPDLAIRTGKVPGSVVGAVTIIPSSDSSDIAVLDRPRREVRVYSSTGSMKHKWGVRRTPTPHVMLPIAMVSLDSQLVVWSDDTALTFASYSPSGQFLRSSRRPTAGDWRAFVYREPYADYEPAVQQGVEDLSRRLATFGHSVLHLLQRNERVAILSGETYDASSPAAYLLRYDATLELRDTLLELKGTPSFPLPMQMDGEAPRFAQPLFSSHPVWASGGAWLAHGHGQGAAVTTINEHGRPMLIVRWRPSARLIVDNDRLAAARWFLDYTSLYQPAFGQRVRSASRAARRAYIQTNLAVIVFADSVPEITAAYGTSGCLWLSGFSAQDYVDGTSLTWLAVNLNTLAVNVIRLPRPGSRVRHVSGGAFFTSHWDSSGTEIIERYPHGVRGCGEALGPRRYSLGFRVTRNEPT